MTQTSFQSSRIFRDTKHFPYGFMRSGVFTTRQAALLEKNGLAYDELASGIRQPQTPEEHQFVEFCGGQRTAQNDHEKVWLQYTQYASRKTSYYSMETGRGKPQSLAGIDRIGDDAWDEVG